MSDERVDRLARYLLLAGHPEEGVWLFGMENTRPQARGIIADPQSLMDALADAGVVVSWGIDIGVVAPLWTGPPKAYAIVPPKPPHRHEWVMDTDHGESWRWVCGHCSATRPIEKPSEEE